MTLRKTLLPIAAVALAAAVAIPLAAAGPGQGPGGGPRGPGDGPFAGRFLERLDAYLDLTDEQFAAAEQIFDATRAQIRPIHEAQRDLHEQLRAALDTDPQDPAAIGALVVALHANREEIRTIREQAQTDFAALLTDAQKARLAALQDARRIFGRGGRHLGGGPAGPGGGDEAGLGFGPGAGFGPGVGPV